MKYIIVFILIVLSQSPAFCSNNDSVDKFDFTNKKIMGGLDIGYAAKDATVPVSFSFVINRWVLSMSYGLPSIWKAEGENYSNSVNWDEFPSDETGKKGYYSSSLGIDVGYLFWKNIAAGIGVSYVMKGMYKNMYDNLHILGDNGAYFLTSKTENKVSADIFLNIYLPLNKTGDYYLVLQPKYSTYYNFIGSIGFGVSF